METLSDRYRETELWFLSIREKSLPTMCRVVTGHKKIGTLLIFSDITNHNIVNIDGVFYSKTVLGAAVIVLGI